MQRSKAKQNERKQNKTTSMDDPPLSLVNEQSNLRKERTRSTNDSAPLFSHNPNCFRFFCQFFFFGFFFHFKIYSNCCWPCGAFSQLRLARDLPTARKTASQTTHFNTAPHNTPNTHNSNNNNNKNKSYNNWTEIRSLSKRVVEGGKKTRKIKRRTVFLSEKQQVAILSDAINDHWDFFFFHSVD